MVSSSSTKRAARLAQKGKGKRVRFQGGTLFPMVVAAILVSGLALIVYARASQPAADASAPQDGDHWHAAYGFMICDEDGWKQLDGNKESQGEPGADKFLLTGVHSHDDGVIHWHPYTAAAYGKRAKLGVFLDVYGVQLSDTKLEFPEEQGGETYEEGETECNGEDAELKVVVWDSYSDTGPGRTYVSNFDDIRIDRDGMVFSIAFVPKDTDVPMPPWAQELPTLSGNDTGQSAPGDTVPESTVPGTATGSTVAGSTPTGDTTEPASTAAATPTTAAPAPTSTG